MRNDVSFPPHQIHQKCPLYRGKGYVLAVSPRTSAFQVDRKAIDMDGPYAVPFNLDPASPPKDSKYPSYENSRGKRFCDEVVRSSLEALYFTEFALMARENNDGHIGK